MHARSDRRSDHIYRVKCRACGAEHLPELGGETEERAERGASVEVLCPRCGETREHDVIAP